MPQTSCRACTSTYSLLVRIREVLCLLLLDAFKRKILFDHSMYAETMDASLLLSHRPYGVPVANPRGFVQVLQL